jgi:CarD family transcriptional regulator
MARKKTPARDSTPKARKAAAPAGARKAQASKPGIPKAKPMQARAKESKPLKKAPAVAPKSYAVKPAAAKPATAAAPAKPALLPKGVAVKQAIAAAAGRQAARTLPATAGKAPVQKVAGPAPAQKAAAASKKPVNQRHGFKTNEWIVYPAHGVGRIVAIEEQEIAGLSLELFVITFEKDKMTLRVPTGKSQSVGMRKLADEGVVRRAMETLKGKARIKRTMWSRRAQEYEAKINSGDLIAIAEVVRDLYRSESQPEQSYSERQLYEAALDRMAREIAAVDKLDERGAVQRITEVLSKSAKGRRAATEEAAAAEVKAA